MASAKEIPPGGEGKIEVTFKTKNRRGKSRKTVTVYSNDPVNPKFKLQVSAELEILFGAKPNRLWFGKISRKDSVTKTIEFTGRDLEKTQIKDIQCLECPEKDVVTWEIDDMRDKKEKKLYLKVTLNPQKIKPGHFNKKLQITTDHPKAKTITVFMSGTVLGPISAKPQRLYLANFEAGKTMTRTITVYSPEKLSFAITDVTVDNPLVKILSVEKDTAESHEIKVSFTPENDKMGRLKAKLTVKTDLKEQPEIEIPVHGYKKHFRSTFKKNQTFRSVPNGLTPIEPNRFPDKNAQSGKDKEKQTDSKK